MRVSLLLAVLAVSVSLVAGSPLHHRLRLNSTNHVDRAHHGHHHAGGQPTSPDVACSFNGHDGQCQTVDSCKGTSVAGQSGTQQQAPPPLPPAHARVSRDDQRQRSGCAGANDIQCCIEQGDFTPGCGRAAIERAMTWVNMQLLYCQSAWGQRDYDSACSEYCERSHNPKWDAYRSDCSGFVSFAYGLPAPGRVTSEFAPYETAVSFQLDSADKLETGDAINSTPSEHIMIFSRWLNTEHTQAEFLEEPGCSDAEPYARVTKSDVSLHDGKITVAANGMTFFPIRFKTNSPTC